MSRVAVVGIHNHGASHVSNVLRLASEGRAELAAVVDPLPPVAGEVPDGVPAFADLAAMLAAVDVDVVVLATPIPTHVPLAELALRAGADVLLEKPPATSTEEFRRLERVVAETGRQCQVGFQSMGWGSVRGLAAQVAAGRLGELRGIGVSGAWVRTAAYYSRARWAGRRVLDGQPVVDGVLTNVFPHGMAAALVIEGSLRSDQVASVEVELHRANPIECDDTSAIRLRTTRGTPIVEAFSVCGGDEPCEPWIEVFGNEGTAVLEYMTGRVTIDGVEQPPLPDTTLLENLIDPSEPLLAELSSTGAFMRALDAVREAPDPAPIDESLLRWHRDPAAPETDHPVVQDVEKWVRRCATELALFHEVGAPWARA